MNAPQNQDYIPEVMEAIQMMMEEANPYADAFRHMYAEENECAAADGRDVKQVRLFFKRGPECRRYNKPTHDEIALQYSLAITKFHLPTGI